MDGVGRFAVVVPWGGEPAPDMDAALHGITVSVPRSSAVDRLQVSPAYVRKLDGLDFMPMPAQYFRDSNGFNALCQSRPFWDALRPYQWVLIHQLDALLLNVGNPFAFVSLEYDFVGAPWPDDLHPDGWRVGNGGLSLRRVSAMREAAFGDWVPPTEFDGPEDMFFASHPAVTMAPWQIAARFAWEMRPEQLAALGLCARPYGVHGYRLYNPEFYQTMIGGHDGD
jgi:Protein of unknown function (DUF5672)